MIESGIATALKARLEDELTGCTVFKHHEAIVAGVPDMSVSWRGTSWLELKHLNPKVEDDPRQRFVIRKLGAVAHVHYVLYLGPKRGGDWRTLVVRPRDLDAWLESGGTEHAVACSRKPYDHGAVADFVRMFHKERFK